MVPRLEPLILQGNIGLVISIGWIVKDWECPELVDILTILSSSSKIEDHIKQLQMLSLRTL